MTQNAPKLHRLIFDGDCGFCTRSVLWLRPRLRGEIAEQVEIQPWQFTDLEGLGLSEHDVHTAAWWIDPDGKKHRGHRAIARVLQSSRGLWPIVGRLLVVPPISWVAALGYRLVARYRGHLPGTTPACRRPDWPPS